MSYGKKDFWNERYSKKSEYYDWYQRYDGLKDIITQYLDRKEKQDKILNIGSGTSQIPQKMYQQGYEKITSIDISNEAVRVMNEKYGDKYPGMRYIEGDIRDAKMFQNQEFDIIIDKGTFDTILCSQYSKRHASSMLHEIFRILQPRGTYICISYGLPQKRLSYFEKKSYDWKIELHKVTKSTLNKEVALKETDSHNYHYIYAMTKLD